MPATLGPCGYWDRSRVGCPCAGQAPWVVTNRSLRLAPASSGLQGNLFYHHSIVVHFCLHANHRLGELRVEVNRIPRLGLIQRVAQTRNLSVKSQSRGIRL